MFEVVLIIWKANKMARIMSQSRVFGYEIWLILFTGWQIQKSIFCLEFYFDCCDWFPSFTRQQQRLFLSLCLSPSFRLCHSALWFESRLMNGHIKLFLHTEPKRNCRWELRAVEGWNNGRTGERQVEGNERCEREQASVPGEQSHVMGNLSQGRGPWWRMATS